MLHLVELHLANLTPYLLFAEPFRLGANPVVGCRARHPKHLAHTQHRRAPFIDYGLPTSAGAPGTFRPTPRRARGDGTFYQSSGMP